MFLAVRKCPSSWMMMITPKISTASRMVTNRFIKFLPSSIPFTAYNKAFPLQWAIHLLQNLPDKIAGAI